MNRWLSGHKGLLSSYLVCGVAIAAFKIGAPSLAMAITLLAILSYGEALDRCLPSRSNEVER